MGSAARVWKWAAIAATALLLFSLPAFSRAEEAASEPAAEAEEQSFVLTLDSSNFSDAVAKHPFIVVEFYAPWCGHCKKLAPEYEKAAAILSKHDPPIVLAKVDANEEANKELASTYQVQGYPTLKILKSEGKNVQEYKGPRDAEGIVEYLKKQVGPPSTELKSSEEARTLFDEKKVYIVGLFSEFSGEEFENYTSVADKLRSDYEFGHTLDPEVLPSGDSTVKAPAIRLFKPFDERVVDFKDFSVDALQKFIEESSLPLVTMFTNDPESHPYVMKFFESDNVKALLFMNFTDEHFEGFKSVYHEVAGKYKGMKVSFLMGDLDASQGAFQYFGLKEEQTPLIIIQTSDAQKYLKANVEHAQIAPWIKDYMEGNVQPYRKSEPIPEVNNEPVKVVVADSLHDVVFNSGKNVLLEFYAPWCGHCQKLAPILEEVAVSVQSDPDLIIAKMDATANDLPSGLFEVQGYPTLYFRSASGKLVRYDEEGRTKEDILGFIQKNRDAAAEVGSVKDEL